MPEASDLGPARLLEKVGEALYGEGWMSPLADDLKVPRRAIQNWLNGRNAIPSGVWRDLIARVRPQAEALCAALGAMADELFPIGSSIVEKSDQGSDFCATATVIDPMGYDDSVSPDSLGANVYVEWEDGVRSWVNVDDMVLVEG